MKPYISLRFWKRNDTTTHPHRHIKQKRPTLEHYQKERKRLRTVRWREKERRGRTGEVKAAEAERAMS